jgi:hypothetical protein
MKKPFFKSFVDISIAFFSEPTIIGIMGLYLFFLLDEEKVSNSHSSITL